jgi:ABC-2 type transporter
MFLLTLRLNLRSKQALVYGYLVPIFFLLAFGSVFRSGIPPLLGQMGQLITISTLGGACFGMPTALVAERERGVWRRYRLLPVSTSRLLASTLAARYCIVASAAIMQIILARLIYSTPLPAHPLQLLIAFTFVAFSFMGMGLVIAALADNVPAVQALGQSIFLPMIMIGGVGVPLIVLPDWAQTVAGFLPGRYAVEALQPCFNGFAGLGHAGFDLIALTVIGVAAFVAGIKLFRWDSNQHVGRSAKIWITLAMVSWLAVGAVAKFSGLLFPVHEIHGISFDNLPPDDGDVTPLAPNVETGLGADDRQRMETIVATLKDWPPAHSGPAIQRVRNLLSAVAVADVTQDALEGRVARAIFEQLQNEYDPNQLQQLLADIIRHPDDGTVITTAPELDFDGSVPEEVVRKRDVIYAKKFLGRLLGKL